MRKYSLLFVGLLGLAVLMSFTFPNKKKKKKVPAPPSMQYIPSGTLHERTDDGKKETSIAGFFMMEVEVTNDFYKEFLADLEKQERTEDLKIAKVQTEKWAQGSGYNEVFVENYFQHPAYADYPLVNISKEAAELYCKWLTEKWKANENKPKSLENLEIEYRLPTKTEWMYAASGGHHLAPYPWGGYYLRNAKGCYLANFRRVDESKIKYNQATEEYEVLKHSSKGKVANLNDFAGITAPVRSYFPNDYGLYNMSGNVSEMLHDGGTKGGSWGSSGYYMQIDAEDEFTNLNGEAHRCVGFRPVAVIKK